MDKLSDAALVTLRNRGIGCSGQRALDAVAAAEELCRRGNVARQLRKQLEFGRMYGADSRGNCVAIDIETQLVNGNPMQCFVHDDRVDSVRSMITAEECRRALTEYVTNGTVRGETVAIFPYHVPKQQGTNMTPTEQLKQAQDAVIAAEKAAAEQAERDAFTARVSRDIELAGETRELLLQIRGGTSHPAAGFAKFRSELNPLALTYGYKLALVGDKTRATLVKV